MGFIGRRPEYLVVAEASLHEPTVREWAEAIAERFFRRGDQSAQLSIDQAMLVEIANSLTGTTLNDEQAIHLLIHAVASLTGEHGNSVYLRIAKHQWKPNVEDDWSSGLPADDEEPAPVYLLPLTMLILAGQYDGDGGLRVDRDNFHARHLAWLRKFFPSAANGRSQQWIDECVRNFTFHTVRRRANGRCIFEHLRDWAMNTRDCRFLTRMAVREQMPRGTALRRGKTGIAFPLREQIPYSQSEREELFRKLRDIIVPGTVPNAERIQKKLRHNDTWGWPASSHLWDENGEALTSSGLDLIVRIFLSQLRPGSVRRNGRRGGRAASIPARVVGAHAFLRSENEAGEDWLQGAEVRLLVPASITQPLTIHSKGMEGEVEIDVEIDPLLHRVMAVADDDRITLPIQLDDLSPHDTAMHWFHECACENPDEDGSIEGLQVRGDTATDHRLCAPEHLVFRSLRPDRSLFQLWAENWASEAGCIELHRVFGGEA